MTMHEWYQMKYQETGDENYLIAAKRLEPKAPNQGVERFLEEPEEV